MAADGPASAAVPGPRIHLSSVRARATLGAVFVGGFVLVLASAILVTALHESLMGDVRALLRSLLEDVVARAAAADGPREVALPNDEDRIVQVIDPDGAVVAASPAVAGMPPLTDAPPGAAAEVAVVIQDELVHLLVSSAVVDGDLRVVAARPFDDVIESTQTVAWLLAAGIPVLLLVVGATTWWVVGRALAPVGAIQREVESISAGRLDRRVPVPSADDEIADLARTMNRMLGRLEDAQTRQRRFVSDASHELRSPLASIRQHAEVALAHPERLTSAELAGTVLAEGSRLQRLTDDLLLLARMDEGDARATDEVDLDDIVAAEARRIRSEGRLTVDASGVGAGRVRGDARTLARMVGNLADNAARHARSLVALSVREDGAWVVVRVDDDGPGVPEAERARVFERFVRLDEDRSRDGGGAGLGLAIVAEVAAAHGGRVDVSSSPSGGARFEVRLPGAGGSTA